MKCAIVGAADGVCQTDFEGNCTCLPWDPCSDGINPECVEKACDDGDPATLNDTCRFLVAAEGDECACRGTVVVLDPCSDILNPTCEYTDCVTDAGGAGACGTGDGEKALCVCGTPVAEKNPCGPALNPTCDPDKCRLPDGSQGECVLDPILGCFCGNVVVEDDPCFKNLNPQCEDRECEDGNDLTVNERCQWVENAAGVEYCDCVGSTLIAAM